MYGDSLNFRGVYSRSLPKAYVLNDTPAVKNETSLIVLAAVSQTPNPLCKIKPVLIEGEHRWAFFPIYPEKMTADGFPIVVLSMFLSWLFQRDRLLLEKVLYELLKI